MFAIIVGGGLFGFLGMILGVPVFAVFYTYFARGINKLLNKKKIDSDTNNSKRTYIYIAKLVADKELTEKIEEKRDKKFSFQSYSLLFTTARHKDS